MKTSRLMAFALTLSVIAVAMIVAGCTGTGNSSPTPVPAPSATPTPTATVPPANGTVEKEYQLTERFNSGIGDYNSGIELMRTAKNLTSVSDYTNASRHMLLASDRMSAAANSFKAMLPYASGPQETSLSQKWSETADYSAMSYRNASDAYAEYAYQFARQGQNLVKYNNFVGQANYYNGLAAESRRQADAIQGGMTFAVPATTPLL